MIPDQELQAKFDAVLNRLRTQHPSDKCELFNPKVGKCTCKEND